MNNIEKEKEKRIVYLVYVKSSFRRMFVNRVMMNGKKNREEDEKTPLYNKGKLQVA
jgi:hypothetical protein